MKFLYPKYDPGLPTVLCINSDQFNRDIVMLQHWSTRYNWVAILDTHLTETQAPWMPERLQKQAVYVNESGPDVDAAWAKARAYGHSILTEAKAKMPSLVAVMAGNWDYWNEECLRMACRDMGVPFLVLMREHNLTPNRKEDAELYERCKSFPRVDGVAVAGDVTMDFITDLKLQPPEILRNTGFPRFDVWRIETPTEYEDPVVLMSYRKGYGADAHFVEMLRRFSAAARRHPDVPFLVKAKHKPEIEMIEAMMPERPGNLKIVDALMLPRLVSNARAIVGFRSISLHECLLTGAPILIPSWGETAMDPTLLAPSPNDARLRGFMDFFTDPAEFERALDKAASAPRSVAVDMAGHHALFAQYFRHSPTELATVRVENFVAEFAGPR